MKHVILFSGGAASSYMAYLLKKDKSIDNKDIVLLHTPTLSECDDSEKFRLKVARFLKLPITSWGDGRDIWELIDDYGAIPGQFMPFCTERLKQEMKEQYFNYLKRCKEEWIEYVGYGPDEWNRVQKSVAKNERLGRQVRFPLFDKRITSEECKKIIHDEWKIELPSAYETLKHNNCIPCFKGGKEYFKAVYLNYPEKYQKAVEKEEAIGHTVFKDISLKDLAVIFQNDKRWKESQYQIADFIPCDCWV